jgi:ankyrin repeat protein
MSQDTVQDQLHNAAINGHVFLMDGILKNGGKHDVPDDRCNTFPLHHAAMGGHNNAIEILLNAGANINCLNCKHRTPLHFATFHNHPNTVKYLLEKGADSELTDINFTKPIDYARRFAGLAEIVEIFEQHAELKKK